MAYTQTCPAERPAGGPFRARSWDALHPRSLCLAARRPRTLSSAGGEPRGGAGDRPDRRRRSLRAGRAPPRGAARAIAERRVTQPFTLLGLPTVRARIRTKGRGGMIAARLWDVHRGKATLVSRGVYRLRDDQKGGSSSSCSATAGASRRARARLELLGSDPGFLRTSNFDFCVRVSGLRAAAARPLSFYLGTPMSESARP